MATAAYKTILLPEVDSMHPATAKQLTTFVEMGGTLLFLGRTPSRAAGLTDNAAESESIRETFERLRKQYPLRTPIVSVRQDDMVGWYRELQQQHGIKPDIAIDRPTDFISQLHYVSGSNDLYFFTHYGPQPAHTFAVTFPFTGRMPWLWNPETGWREPYPMDTASNTLTLTLGPSESKLIVFEASSRGRAEIKRLHETKVTLEDRVIETPWTVELIHVNGTRQTTELVALHDLSEDEAYKSFAGSIVYRNHLVVPSAWQTVEVHLGHVHNVTQMQVNGKALGTRWYGEQSYDISHALHAGDNQISVTVTTTLGNYMKTLPDNKAAHAWTSRTPFYPIGLTQPVRVVIAG